MSILIVVVSLLAAAIGFMILRRALRMALRLALVGMLMLALLVGGLLWWGYRTFYPSAEPTPRTTRPTSTRPARSR